MEYGKGLLFEAVAKTYLITLSSLVALNLRALGGYDLRILPKYDPKNLWLESPDFLPVRPNSFGCLE